MCEKKVYDYYAIIDGEEIKVDYCFTNMYGTGYCEYNGYTYHNVPSRAVVVDVKEDCIYMNILLIPSILVIIYFAILGIKYVISLN